MSNIPEVPLWTACTINDEVLPESTTPEYEFEYVDISSVSQGRVSDNLELQIFESAPSRARRLARPGDVLVSTVRTYLRAIAPVEHEGRVYSTGFAVLRALEGVSDPRFLNHMMASMPVIEDIRIRSTGVSYPAITPTELARIRVPLPPLEEQRRIADHLDAETAQIDGMMAELDELVRILDVRRVEAVAQACLLYTSPSPRDQRGSRMPSSA